MKSKIQLTLLIASFEINLLAENKAPGTIRHYVNDTMEPFAVWINNTHGIATLGEIDQNHLREYLIFRRQRVSDRTVLKDFVGLQQFFRWVVKDDFLEESENPMRKVDRPKVRPKMRAIIPKDSFEKLLGQCKGKDFEARRNLAILMVFWDTGIRRNEMVQIALSDVDMRNKLITVLGKGGRERIVPIGKKTAKALDRYIIERSGHPQNDVRNKRGEALWLSPKGLLTGDGVRMMLERLEKRAGIPHIHPHLFRHTFSHDFLVNGGQETDLMRHNGWASTQMASIYGASAGEERAREAYHRIGAPTDRLK